MELGVEVCMTECVKKVVDMMVDGYGGFDDYGATITMAMMTK